MILMGSARRSKDVHGGERWVALPPLPPPPPRPAPPRARLGGWRGPGAKAKAKASATPRPKPSCRRLLLKSLAAPGAASGPPAS
eukprot:SAG31_NODE_83_length_27039_cov_14.035746_14_plen_84_part_00